MISKMMLRESELRRKQTNTGISAKEITELQGLRKSILELRNWMTQGSQVKTQNIKAIGVSFLARREPTEGKPTAPPLLRQRMREFALIKLAMKMHPKRGLRYLRGKGIIFGNMGQAQSRLNTIEKEYGWKFRKHVSW